MQTKDKGRKIQFKGKTIDTNEWVYGSLVNFTLNSFIYVEKPLKSINPLNPPDCCCCGDFYNIYNVNLKTVGQFIGMLDKNKKEIYEHDKVIFRNRIGLIIYCGGEFSIECDNDLHNLSFYQHNSEVEVIGNMFDGGLNERTKIK